MNKSTNRSDLLGDFMKGAVKGIVTGALLMGAMWAVFTGLALIPGVTIALPFVFEAGHLATLGGILLTSGLVNGALRAYTGATSQHHVNNGNMREAHLTQASPTLIPLLGLEHGVSADHALEVEHHDRGSQRQWAQSVNRGNADRVQEILQNGSMSDKDRASAILREREERATAPQGLSA
jgi:hypothetical protein